MSGTIAKPTTLHALVKANTADTIENTTKLVEDALKLTAWQRQVLHSVLLNEVRRMDRHDLRVIEPRWTGGEKVDPTAQRAEYLRGTFVGLGGRRVAWAEATVEDHQARIVFLSSLRDGLTRTIQAHETAVRDILAVPGATCLGDLPSVRPGDDEVVA